MAASTWPATLAGAETVTQVVDEADEEHGGGGDEHARRLAVAPEHG